MHLQCTYGGYLLRSSDIRPMAFLARHRSPEHGRGWLLFDRPERVLEAKEPSHLASLFEELDSAILQGKTIAGFVSYEGAVAWGLGVSVRPSRPGLAWFAVQGEPPLFYSELLPEDASIAPFESRADLSIQGYARAFEEVKAALARGDAYQVNLTYRHRFGDLGNPANFFADRCGVDPPDYAAYIHGGDWHILSFSPEAFLERTGAEASMRPMKGTARATGRVAEDALEADRLVADPKTLAENLMIVDMVRHDLGSIAEIGSVAVPALMEVERHRRLLQAVSTVTARSDASFSSLLKAVLPVASVTGAPKRMACGIIDRLEGRPRNVYCGILGIANRERQAFSVAIRTALYDSVARQGEFGVGSGVVWDSDCRQEYEECEAKTDLLRHSAPRWSLVEAMRLGDVQAPERRERHLARLGSAARELGIPFDAREAERLLTSQTGEAGQKLRLLLKPEGRLSAEATASAVPPGTIDAVLVPGSVRSSDRSLWYKTTGRQLFQDLLEEHPGYEVLMGNERGEATEFTRGSLVARIAGRLVTPDPSSGCLAGVTVRQWADEGRVAVERVTIDDLLHADGVWFANAVVGLRPVRLHEPTGKVLLKPDEYSPFDGSSLTA
ncbi:MAG TPA: chorismate-binding protein [Fimbriimonas sp.]